MTKIDTFIPCRVYVKINKCMPKNCIKNKLPEITTGLPIKFAPLFYKILTPKNSLLKYCVFDNKIGHMKPKKREYYNCNHLEGKKMNIVCDSILIFRNHVVTKNVIFLNGARSFCVDHLYISSRNFKKNSYFHSFKKKCWKKRTKKHIIKMRGVVKKYEHRGKVKFTVNNIKL